MKASLHSEELRRIVQWVNHHFASSPPGRLRYVGSSGTTIRTDGRVRRLNSRKARRDLPRQNMETLNDKPIVR
jgi:hypothetical protein